MAGSVYCGAMLGRCFRPDLGGAQRSAAHCAPVGQEEFQGRTRPPALHPVHLILLHQHCLFPQAGSRTLSFLFLFLFFTLHPSAALLLRRTDPRLVFKHYLHTLIQASLCKLDMQMLFLPLAVSVVMCPQHRSPHSTS